MEEKHIYIWWDMSHPSLYVVDDSFFVYIFGLSVLKILFYTAFWGCLSLWLLFFINANVIYPSKKNLPPLLFKGDVPLQVSVSVLINIEDFISVFNQISMNVWLRRENNKLHRQYVYCLYIVVIRYVSNWFYCDDHFTLVNVWILIWLLCRYLVW